MNFTDHIRKALKTAGIPLNLDQVMEQMPVGADRNTVSALLSQRTRAGEFARSMEDRTVCYAWSRDKHRQDTTGNSKPKPIAAPAAANASAANGHAAPASPPAPAPKMDESLAESLNHAVEMAEAARDAYVESLVNQDIYTWMQQSVAAARAARDAFVGGAS